MKTALVSSLLILASALPAFAQSADFTTESVQLNSSVRVEAVSRGGQDFERIEFADGTSAEFPTEMPGTDATGLTQEQLDESRAVAEGVYESVIQAVTSDNFEGSMAIDSEGAAVVAKPSAKYKVLNQGLSVFRDWIQSMRLKTRIGLQVGIMENRPDLYSAAPKGGKLNAKAAHYLKLVWQFMVVETVHAAIDFYDRRKAAPKQVEYGLSLDLKIEPQIYIGKFRPTAKFAALKNSYGLAFEVSFDFRAWRGHVRSRLRREQGAGGLGLPAARIEAKVFSTDGTHGVQGGQSWYPVSPPLATFVFDRDNHGHYFAAGVALGAASGDLIPGTTLTNSFANYTQKENAIEFSKLPRAAVNLASEKLHLKHALTCQALFH